MPTSRGGRKYRLLAILSWVNERPNCLSSVHLIFDCYAQTFIGHEKEYPLSTALFRYRLAFPICEGMKANNLSGKQHLQYASNSYSKSARNILLQKLRLVHEGVSTSSTLQLRIVDDK